MMMMMINSYRYNRQEIALFILNFLNLFQVYITKNTTEIHQCLSCGDPHYHPLQADTFGPLVNYFFTIMHGRIRSAF